MLRNYILLSTLLHASVLVAAMTLGDTLVSSSEEPESEAVVVVQLEQQDSKPVETPEVRAEPVTPKTEPEPPELPVEGESINYAGTPKGEEVEPIEPEVPVLVSTETQTDDNSPLAMSLASGIKRNLQQAETLISDGAQLPGFRVSSINLELITLLSRLGLCAVVAEYKDREPAYVIVNLSASGNPAKLTTISGVGLKKGFSTRAIVMPRTVVRSVAQHLSRTFGIAPDRVLFFTSHRLDRLILSAQLQVCSELGVALEKAEWTDGQFDVAGGKIAGFRISLIGFYSGESMKVNSDRLETTPNVDHNASAPSPGSVPLRVGGA